jgi:hypothetical protein
MSIESIFSAITTQAGNVAPFGAKLKFVMGDDIILIDGTGDSNVVSNEDAESACTITMDADTFYTTQKRITKSYDGSDVWQNQNQGRHGPLR